MRRIGTVQLAPMWFRNRTGRLVHEVPTLDTISAEALRWFKGDRLAYDRQAEMEQEALNDMGLL